MKYTRISVVLVALSALFLASCGGGDDEKSQVDKSAREAFIKKAMDPMEDRGIGPIKDLVLPAEIDAAMAEEGKKIYDEMCSACHKAEKKYIGPSPKGIFERRHPAWVMNMILNPEEMVAQNTIAKALLIEYNGSPMANQNLTEDQARKVLEYFRTLN